MAGGNREKYQDIRFQDSQANPIRPVHTRAHMRAMPLEILITIFSYTLPDGSESSTFDSRKSPLILLHVCRLWRKLALSVSSLWASFEVHISRRTDSHTIDALNFWLKLSRHQSLTVALVYVPPQNTLQRRFNSTSVDIVRTLMCHALRWRHMRFVVPSATLAPLFAALQNGTLQAADLTSLDLDMQGVWCAHLPGANATTLLRTIKLDKITELNCSLDMRGLLTVDEMYSVFRAATQLAKCKLAVKLNSRGDLSLTDERRVVTMGNLRDVDLVFHYTEKGRDPPIPPPSLRVVLDALSFPFMEHFGIEWPSGTPSSFSDHDDIVSSLSSLIARSRETLKRLSLRYVPMCSEQMVALLLQVPMLVDLDIRVSMNGNITDPVLDYLHSSTPYGHGVLPRLQFLSIHDTHHQWSPGAMLSLLNGRRFRSFELYTTTVRYEQLEPFVNKWGDGQEIVMHSYPY